jgi:hypothetical protein
VFTDLRRNRDVDIKSEWETCFRPGQMIGMSMIFRHEKIGNNNIENANTCPSCGSTSSQSTSEAIEWYVMYRTQ